MCGVRLNTWLSWKKVKEEVTNLLRKHDCKVLSARKWEDRKLAYEIRGQKRGTYLLSYVEMDGKSIPSLKKDFMLTEFVLRHLVVRAEAVPEEEIALSVKEDDELSREPEVIEEEETSKDSGGEVRAEQVVRRVEGSSEADGDASDDGGEGSEEKENKGEEDSH